MYKRFQKKLVENPKFLVMTLIVCMVIIITIMLIALTFIWTPKQSESNLNETNSVSKLGYFKYEFISENDIVKKYSSYILSILGSGNEEQIKSIILPEYLKYKGINEKDIVNALNKKQVLGKMLQFSDYTVMSHYKYGKIYEVKVKSIDNMFSDNIIIVEKSPNNFKISFDNFIGSDYVSNSFINGNLKLTVIETVEFKTFIKYKIRIDNVSDYKLLLNKENSYEIAYLRLSNGSEIKLNSVWLGGKSLVLKSGESIEANLDFKISDLNSGTVKGIVLKGVYNEFSNELSEFIFDFN